MDNLFLTNEAFIRRAAMINGDFMLKGSFLTRQYFPDPTLRNPADLDWLYFGKPIEDVNTARKTFDKWITAVTEFQVNDNVQITSFTENAFWRMIDYAMDDDFPTVNTDLSAKVGEEEIDFFLDLSFNLDPELPPVGIMYRPAQGDPFYLPHTAAPANQIAWKLHQSIVRLRFKDLFDLYFMLQSSAFDEEVLTQALAVYVNECGADKKDPKQIKHLLNGEWENLLVKNKKMDNEKELKHDWDIWRNNKSLFYYRIETITDHPDAIPVELDKFKAAFVQVCSQSGLTKLSENLPEAKDKKRTKFLGLF